MILWHTHFLNAQTKAGYAWAHKIPKSQKKLDAELIRFTFFKLLHLF